jgi:hypothetical protein
MEAAVARSMDRSNDPLAITFQAYVSFLTNWLWVTGLFRSFPLVSFDATNVVGQVGSEPALQNSPTKDVVFSIRPFYAEKILSGITGPVGRLQSKVSSRVL